MRLRTALPVGILGLAAWGALHAQKPFKEYPAIEYENFALPPDWNQKAEWTRARLRYPDIYGYPNHNRYRLRGGEPFPGMWTMDYPRSDRHLLRGVRRLTRIDARSVEQVVSLDGEDEIYNWPVLYGVEVGHWLLPDDEAKQLREFLARGGFFMCDDFHGDQEWATFTESMTKVFPDRPIEDIPDKDPIFHTLYDLDERFQVPGALYFETGLTYEKGESGKVPHWRCIRDDKGRIVVAICHNMDLGDAWEWSDDPKYLEKWASLAYRIAMNYFIYDLTH
ncbi:MAG: hypothetical protein DMG59_05080 [Acidobacteria bacterium]|nr:MAG: hypothetical protein DMG59_05080 [Acidobacteriota bacterium]